MAKPAKFIKNNDDSMQILASFPNGRYHFSLQPGAVTLLQDLGYEPDDTIPWELFQIFVAIGDAWLPNANVEHVDNLAEPASTDSLSRSEIKGIANHLPGKRIDQQAKQQLESVLDESYLAQHIDTDDLTDTADWVKKTKSLISDDARHAGTADSDDFPGKSSRDDDPAEGTPTQQKDMSNTPDSLPQPSAADADTTDLTESVLTRFRCQIEQSQQLSQATKTVLTQRLESGSFGDDDDILAAIIKRKRNDTQIR